MKLTFTRACNDADNADSTTGGDASADNRNAEVDNRNADADNDTVQAR